MKWQSNHAATLSSKVVRNAHLLLEVIIVALDMPARAAEPFPICSNRGMDVGQRNYTE